MWGDHEELGIMARTARDPREDLGSLVAMTLCSRRKSLIQPSPKNLPAAHTIRRSSQALMINCRSSDRAKTTREVLLINMKITYTCAAAGFRIKAGELVSSTLKHLKRWLTTVNHRLRGVKAQQ
jgi:hypothetical protein